MSTRVVRFGETTPTRWANGAGETVELWRMPAHGDFELRLSIATVGSSAPFSELPGVERALMALAPGGLVLEIDGVRHPLARYQVARFAGESSVRAVDVREPGHDLNLMTRRAAGPPVLRFQRVDGTHRVVAGGAAVVLDGELALDGLPLAFGDTVIAEGSGDGDGAVLHGHGVVATAWVE